MVVIFIRVKRDSMPFRVRERAGSSSGCFEVLENLHTCTWVWEREGFLSNYLISFLALSGLWSVLPLFIFCPASSRILCPYSI